MKSKSKFVVNIFVGVLFVIGILTFYNTFSFDNEYVFDSLVYDINNGYINGVSSNTSVGLYYKYFDMENCTIEVVDLENEKIVSGFVTGGSKTVLYDNNGNVITSYTNIIKGDYNSDGIIDNNDFYGMGDYLVNDKDMDDELLLRLDIDGDSEFHINDIMLLDKAITLGYNSISMEKDSLVLQSNAKGRLVARVEPYYGVNLNVRWISDDESIATVDESGVVTGHNEGSTVIRATTFDGKYETLANVTVDNTILLDSYSGVGYVGGEDVVVGIRAVSYDDITCVSDNKDVAMCKIKNKNLVIETGITGSANIVVNSDKYGSATYEFFVNTRDVSVSYKYVCLNVGGSGPAGYAASFHGESFFEINDLEIIRLASIQSIGSANGIMVYAGNKAGRTRVKIIDVDGNTRTLVTADVYKLELSEMGKEVSVGNSVSTDIIGDNLGELSCKITTPSGDKNVNNSLGSCEFKDNKLIVTPLVDEDLWVYVYNSLNYNGELYNCAGSALFYVVVNG